MKDWVGGKPGTLAWLWSLGASAPGSPTPTCDEASAILIHSYAGCAALENVVPARMEGEDKR